MCNNTIRPALPLIEAECDEENQADREVGAHVWFAPLIRTASPVEREQQKRCGNDDEEAADWIARPCPLLETHFRVVGALLWPVEGEETKRSEAV